MSYAKRIKRKKLAIGGTMLVSSFPSHGQVSFIGSMRGGKRLAGNDVLAEAHAAMLLEGTKKRSKAQIQVVLDEIGATLSFAVERDRLTFSGHVRDQHLKKLLTLVAEVLASPLFPASELVHYKERAASELALEGQDTRAQAGINLSRKLFKPEHPNYQESTEESIESLLKLSRSDLVSYHARAIDLGSLIVSVASDMPLAALQTTFESAFARLPHNESALPAYEPSSVDRSEPAAVRIADKASIDYMLGIATGITKASTDYIALQLGLQVLGNRGGFTGRLMKTVREIEGLTYGVYAYPAGFSKADGYIIAWATFAPELYERGKAALMREIRKIVEEGATDEEIRKHRSMYEARSRVTLSSSSDLARAAHDITVEGYLPSHLDEYPQRMLKVTRAQVNTALKKYLRVDQLTESAAGPIVA